MKGVRERITDIHCDRIRRISAMLPASTHKAGVMSSSLLDGLSWRNQSLVIEANHTVDNLVYRLHLPTKLSGVEANTARGSIPSEGDMNYKTLMNTLVQPLKSSVVMSPNLLRPSPSRRIELPQSGSKMVDMTTINLPMNTDGLPRAIYGGGLVLEKMTEETFLLQALESNESSLLLQDAILETSTKNVQKLVDLAYKTFDTLIESNRGSFVVQKLIHRSEIFSTWLINLHEDTLTALVVQDHGRRALQYLLLKRPEFCVKALAVIRSKFESFISTIPGVFFICACLRRAKRCKLDVNWLFNYLLSDSTKVLTSKYRKRILLTLLRSSTDAFLDKTFMYIFASQTMVRIMSDKYLSSILSHMVNKGYAPAVDLVQINLQERPLEMLQYTFFKRFLTRLELKTDSPFMNIICDTALMFRKTSDMMEPKSKEVVMTLISAASKHMSLCSNRDHQWILSALVQNEKLQLSKLSKEESASKRKRR